MIIVFEGIDCCGKTTLANYVSRKYNIPIYNRYKYTNKKEWENMMNLQHIIEINEINLLKHIDRANVNIILDRFIPTFVIYHKIFKRKSDISYINSYRFKNIIYLYIYVDRQVLLNRYYNRKDHNINDINIYNKLYDAYNMYYQKNKDKMYFIDNSYDLSYSKRQLRTILDKIIG